MKRLTKALISLTPAILLLGCAEQQVSYQEQVRPLLEKYCVRCHTTDGEGYQKSGFSMDSYEALMQGTRYGPVVKPGDSFTSAIVMLVEGRADPALKMPHDEGDTPTAEEIELIKRWIDQGAKQN